MKRCPFALALFLVVMIACGGFVPAAELTGDMEPCYIIPIEGSLAALEYDTYGPFHLAGWQCITAQVFWSPECSGMSIILVACSGYRSITIPLTGGSGGAEFCQVPAGCYYIRVRNDGPCQIYYTGGIFTN